MREIRPSDFPETTTVGFALEISFQRHQLYKDPTVGLSGMFDSNLNENSARMDYIYKYNYIKSNNDAAVHILKSKLQTIVPGDPTVGFSRNWNRWIRFEKIFLMI